MTALLVIPAEVNLAPIYVGAALVLGLVVFILGVAWAVRATAVAVLAIGLCLAGGAVLGVSTAWLADADGPLSPGDTVVLRFVAALFVGIVIAGVLVSRRCWKTERSRASVPAASTDRRSHADYDRDWILSLLQQKTQNRGEKVSTSAEPQPTTHAERQISNGDNALS